MASERTTCPFCPPSTGSKASVQKMADGSFSCRSCNAHWRDINRDTNAPLHAVSNHEVRNDHRLHKYRPYNHPRVPAHRQGKGARFIDEPPLNNPPSSGFPNTAPRPRTALLALTAASAFLITAFATTLLINHGSPLSGSIMAGTSHNGLAIDNVTFERTATTARNKSDTQTTGSPADIIRVKGRILNTGHKPIAVPDLLLALKDEHGTPVFTWRYEPGQKALEPASTLRFTSSITGIAARFQRVDVEVMNIGASSHNPPTPLHQ